MGMDIHMNIIDKNGNIKCADIFDGRNREWFDNLRGHGYDSAYNVLFDYVYSGIPDNATGEVKEDYECSQNKTIEVDRFFGFFYITVKEYKKWFDKYRPDLDAVWITTYEKWLYDKKHIYPENASHYLPEDANKDDYQFVEIENQYECGGWLYDFCEDHNLEDDDIISYYFDW